MNDGDGILLKSELPLPVFVSGKVRDTFELGDYLLIVATDRISAFDVVLPAGIPEKGKVLTQLSAFWFGKTADLVPNHVVEIVSSETDLSVYFDSAVIPQIPPSLIGRAMIVKKAKRLPVECVVRGYLSGSGWAEYRRRGSVCGIELPSGLVESQRLATPLFTPTTKADAGHDMPLTMGEVENLVGIDIAGQIKEASLAVYALARKYALERGIIIADTKMEFGLLNGTLILIDEILTPDSSRFWDIGTYREGVPQDSYDKQPLRDWLELSGWNKEPPGPVLPASVIDKISQRYIQVFEKLTGTSLV